MSFTFICYHTTDRAWTGEHRFLRACCKELGLPLHTRRIEPDTWQRATQYKARFVRDCLREMPGQRLVYIDVDSCILRRPALLADVDADVAACMLSSELLSGVVVFGGGPKCVEVVDRWIELNGRYPEKLPDGREAWDQRTLKLAIDQTPGARFTKLPPDYNWIPSIGERFIDPETVRPVIVATRGSFRINPTHA